MNSLKLSKTTKNFVFFLVIDGPVQQNQIIKPSISIDNIEQK